VKYVSIMLTAATGGVLLGLLLFMYACYKLRVSPWFFPKHVFFCTLGTVVVGIALEVWIAIRYRTPQEDLDDDGRDAGTE
jgi:hypothetical protein